MKRLRLATIHLLLYHDPIVLCKVLEWCWYFAIVGGGTIPIEAPLVCMEFVFRAWNPRYNFRMC